ncbi:MAG: hypothetical protein IPL98_07595 [Saprospiraceae bacterium]|nr:hypothetical protein [Saprospiraceae bacterium]
MDKQESYKPREANIYGILTNISFYIIKKDEVKNLLEKDIVEKDISRT